MSTNASPPNQYRLYRMNALTGEILSHLCFEAYSDDQAIERALTEAGERRIELWCDGRKLLAVSGAGAPTELRIAPPAP